MFEAANDRAGRAVAGMGVEVGQDVGGPVFHGPAEGVDLAQAAGTSRLREAISLVMG